MRISFEPKKFMTLLKRLLIILPITLLLTHSISPVTFGADVTSEEKEQNITFSIDKTSYIIGGKSIQTDAAPYIKDGRTMVPVAFVAPALGTEPAHWNPASRVVTIKKGDKNIAITIGSKELLINGKKLQMDTAAEIQDVGGGGGRTMIPIAFIARALEVGYEWDATVRAVTFYGYNMVYDQEGHFGSDFGVETLQGNVVIKADGVVLQNMLIKGNLTIDREVGQGTVTLSNVTVNGTTYIRGGGPDSIYINGGQYANIHIQNADGKVRVVAQDVNNLPVVIAEDAAGQEVILEGVFQSVTIEGANAIVSTKGQTTINTILVPQSAVNSTLNINSGSKVDRLVLNSNTSVRGSGTVRVAEVNADGVTFNQQPERQIVAENVQQKPATDSGSYFIPVQSIVINTESQTIAVGDTLSLETTISPTEVTFKNVIWTSDAEAVATVNSNGLVIARGPGTASITVTTQDGFKTDSVIINVLASMSGTASIVGTAEYGEILTADISGISYSPSAAGDVLHYQWKRDGIDIEGEIAETYTLNEADLGHRITLTVTSDGIHALGSVASEPTAVVEKAFVATPSAPVLSEKTATSITLLTNPVYEYSIDEGPWQESGEFTGLAALSTHIFKCRVKETATHKASAASEGTSITTNPPVMTGTVTITGTAKFGEVLTANPNLIYTPATEDDIPSYQWKRGGVDIAGATGTTYTLVQADVGQTITVVVAADGSNATGSIISEPTEIIEKADEPAAPSAPVLLDKTATSITLEITAAYEYTKDNGVTWQTANVFTGLNPLTEYTFKARVKETATHYASAISEGTVIKTNPPAMSGTLTITGTLKYGELLTAIPSLSYTPSTEVDSPSYQWKRNGVDIAGAIGMTYTLAEADIGQTITVTVSADGINALGSVTSSAAGIIDKADGPEAPDEPILAEKTYTTVSLVAYADYEYTKDDGATWQDSEVFTNLIPATEYSFRVRVRATSTHNASATSPDLFVRTVAVPPVFCSAQISSDGRKVIITFDKEMAAVVPTAPAGFTVNLAGIDNPVTLINRHATETTQYELTLRNSVHHGQLLTVNYYGESVTSADGGIIKNFQPQNVDTTTRTYSIGDPGPASGYIFYNEGTGSFKYLEAAPASTEWYGKIYGELGVSDGNARDTAIGTGQVNTTKIVNAHPAAVDRAAQLCDALVVTFRGTVYDDWFLPSIDELHLIYLRLRAEGTRVINGGFIGDVYWSSTEHSYSSTWAWYERFDDAAPEHRQYYGSKSSSVFYTRAIRSF